MYYFHLFLKRKLYFFYFCNFIYHKSWSELNTPGVCLFFSYKHLKKHIPKKYYWPNPIYNIFSSSQFFFSSCSLNLQTRSMHSQDPLLSTPNPKHFLVLWTQLVNTVNALTRASSELNLTCQRHQCTHNSILRAQPPLTRLLLSIFVAF